MKALLLFSLIFITLSCVINNENMDDSSNVDNNNFVKTKIDTVPFKWNPTNSFKQKQLSFERVQEAYDQKQLKVEKMLKAVNCYSNKFELKFRAFKTEEILEVWIKPDGDNNFKKLIDYDICLIPGELGPKKTQGDMQVPEGVYHIDRFNPMSKFHLSLGINYPNSTDLKRSSRKPGGDIFIHGRCVSIGCLPMTDDKIKEIYILAIESKDQMNSKIKVEIFPFRMNKDNISENDSLYQENKSLYDELSSKYSSI